MINIQRIYDQKFNDMLQDIYNQVKEEDLEDVKE